MKKLVFLVYVFAAANLWAQQPPEKLSQAIANQDNDLGNTSLHCVTSIEQAQALIRAGANINAQNKLRWTPLHYAVNNNRIDLVELFIQAGANTKLKDKWGRTPSQVAYTATMADLVIELTEKQKQQKKPLPE